MTLKIIHTADWHLGDRLGGVDRLADQFARVQEVIAYAEMHRADVLLVCGDVLEEPRPERLASIISELAELLSASIARGMQCVFIAGNHDSNHTFELLAGVQNLIGSDGAERVKFVNRPCLIPLAPHDKPDAVLLALPYPTAGVYPLGTDPRSVDEKRAALSEAVGACVEALSEQASDEYPGLPKIMAGHLLLSDVPARTGAREVAESEDVRVSGARLAEFAYVALGHVHQPSAPAPNIRYSGALDRVDFGEADEDRHVLLAELQGDAEVQLQQLDLEATPLQRVVISAFEEIAEQAELIDDRDRTIVKLELRLRRDDPAGVWLAAAREAFPRLMHPVELIRLDAPDPPLLTGNIEVRSPEETVRAFLTDQLADDPDIDQLMRLIDEILSGAEVDDP